jgi:hypothetical protein
MTSIARSTTVEWRVGAIATTVLAIVLLGWALTVDYPKVTGGFFSDGATYYSLAHSLAEDGDFEFKREDLERVWREYASGPEGIFLKRGRDVHGVELSGGFPFVRITSGPDWDTTRLYYGKSFVYPLFAAPLVWLFGTNGFLVLHAVLMTLCFAGAYAFLLARGTAVAALIFAIAFLFASVVPIYMVWLTPDFFNFAILFIGYFFWAYKEVAPDAAARAGDSRLWPWLLGPRSDIVAAFCLGIATFSKPTHIVLIGPLLALFLWRRQWRRGVLVGLVFVAVTAGFFGWNLAISGEWNYQGGEERSTFYSQDLDGPGPRLGGFPFQTPEQTFDSTGSPRETNALLVDVVATSDAITQVFRRNLGYFFVGRHTGFIPYYFPGAAAIALMLAGPRRRPMWQWLTLAGGLGSAIFLLLYMPYTYSGGGGPVGNRYFLGVYSVFLFLTPPLTGLRSAFAALAGGAYFTAQLVFNPFYVSVHPGEHSKKGVYTLLPVELTLLNDLPVNLVDRRVKQPLGGDPPLLAYFIDDNAYNREADAFWVRGASRAEIMLRVPATGEGASAHPLRLSKMTVQLETGAMANRVTVDGGTSRQVVDIPAHDSRSITLDMPPGLPYKAFPGLPTNYVHLVAITSETGFIPMFEGGGRDSRYLGVFVRLIPQYD